MALFKMKVPKIGGTIGSIGEKAKTAGSDAWSYGVSKPTQATAQSIQSGSFKPMQNYLGNAQEKAGDVWDQAIKDPINKIGDKVGGALGDLGGAFSDLFKNMFADNQKKLDQELGTGPNYSQFKINKASSPKMGLNLTDGTSGDNIGQQYTNMQNLAKMREGSALSAEQAAIQRRLAASGMGASGAGMRMQQQAQQASARRLAEQQLGLGAEEARARQQEAELAKNRDFQERQFEYQQQKDAAEFEANKAITEENQKIARANARYNNAGLFGQLGQDIFGPAGRKTSMRDLFGAFRS